MFIIFYRFRLYVYTLCVIIINESRIRINWPTHLFLWTSYYTEQFTSMYRIALRMPRNVRYSPHFVGICYFALVFVPYRTRDPTWCLYSHTQQSEAKYLTFLFSKIPPKSGLIFAVNNSIIQLILSSILLTQISVSVVSQNSADTYSFECFNSYFLLIQQNYRISTASALSIIFFRTSHLALTYFKKDWLVLLTYICIYLVCILHISLLLFANRPVIIYFSNSFSELYHVIENRD